MNYEPNRATLPQHPEPWRPTTMADPATPDLDSSLVAPEISCRLVLPFLHAIEERAGRQVAEAVVEDAGLPWTYLADANNWVSWRWTQAFFLAWAHHGHGLDHEPAEDHPIHDLWYDVGRKSMTPEVMGVVFGLLWAIGSPGTLYTRLPDITARGNRLIKVEILEHGRGRTQMSVRAVEGTDFVLPYHLIRNMQGVLESIPTVWGLDPATVETRKDGETSVWTLDIRYGEQILSRPLQLLLVCLGLALPLGLVGHWLGGPLVGALGACVGVLSVATVLGWQRNRELRSRLAERADETWQVLAQTDQRYADLHAESLALKRSLLASRKLSGYLAQDLVDRIINEPEFELELGGQRTHAAVLFADIVNFTPRCESMPPEQVLDELNTYFAHVDPSFEDHGGVIDKRMGDGIMAVFVPRPHEAAATLHARAVGCGLDMLRALEPCNQTLTARGAAPMQIRIGVAAGQLVQGNMGSPVKLEYTVVGDAVNLAARLEGMATPGHLLVTTTCLPTMCPETGPFQQHRQDTIRVKGKASTVEVVELAALQRPDAGEGRP